jgi:hypothetical protein
MILRSMLVPEKIISQDETVGSYSMAKTHLDIFLLSVDGLINELSDCITSQFIKPLLRINYGDDFPDVDFQIETLSQQNRELLQEILIEMIKEDKITPDADKIASFLGIDIK